jgi:two-component system, OmpR family, response regulator
MEFAKPKKIFIVDDDLMLSEAMTDFLTRKIPHKVTAFNTGEECLKHISDGPDVVILDFHLNTVHKAAANGMEILQTIKKHYPGIYVIMLSSQDRYGVAMQTIQKGAEQYIIKDEDAFEKINAILKEL